MKPFLLIAIIVGFHLPCLQIVAAEAAFAQAGAHSQVASGMGNFSFTDQSGSAAKTISVWYFRPKTLKADSKIVFVMHGVNRDADRYCKDWSAYAEQGNFLLVCPEFDARDFPTSAYQCGNMFDESHNPILESSWTFSTIERLFDYVRTSFANTSKDYYIYGHSAGGQFVQRFVLFMPAARYRRAIAANPGWYTMPVYTGHRFPYGLRDSGLSESKLRTSLGRDFVLLLGDEDVDSEDPNLRQTANAEEQGATRRARGQNYFQAAKLQASKMGARFGWRLETVAGARHSDAQMAQTAAPALFAN